MGLDIVAYNKLELISLDIDGGDLSRSKVGIKPNPHFKDHLLPLQPGLYSFENEFHFRAGSYSGYNRWREWLAELVGTTLSDVWNGFVPDAFGELIFFSDCEGAIGTALSCKLAKDFEQWHEKAEALIADKYDSSFIGKEWMSTYNDFKHAFDMASEGGVVKFC